jgi:hypothetical protein
MSHPRSHPRFSLNSTREQVDFVSYQLFENFPCASRIDSVSD